MDDQEVIREAIGEMLQSLGYTPVYKENGKDAIDFVVLEVKAHRTFAGMIFDLTVPGGMGGREAIEEIRKLSKALIVPAFIKTGLKQSVEDLVENILVAKKINITVDTEELDETNISEGLKITLYRIIQEQLNNILKYAEASAVTIRINTRADTILLSINDDGKGFDTHLERKGVGITNINSRAALFNGKVEIDSSKGNGCLLTVVMDTKAPVPQKAA